MHARPAEFRTALVKEQFVEPPLEHGLLFLYTGFSQSQTTLSLFDAFHRLRPGRVGVQLTGAATTLQCLLRGERALPVSDDSELIELLKCSVHRRLHKHS